MMRHGHHGSVGPAPGRTIAGALLLCLLPLTAAAQAPAAAAAGSDFDAVAARASETREAGQLDEAAVLYEQALRLNPNWPEGWWYLGTILYDLNASEEARDAFRRLVYMDPEHGAGWAFKGLCEFQLGNYDEALEDLQIAGAFGAGAHEELRPVLRYHTGILLTRHEQYEASLQMLGDFAKENNDSTRVIEALGLATLRMPMLPSELPAARREMVLMAGRAGFHQAARSQVAARRAYEALVARYPETPNVHYAFGSFLVAEESDLALEHFQRELKISPIHVPALLQIAFEHLKRGDHEAALPLAREAVDLDPTMFPARKALGEALLAAGDIPAAVEQLEAGVRLAPDSPAMRFTLARAYARAGRADEAARERAEFLRLDKLYRAARSGAQSIGGLIDEPPEN